MSLQSDSLHSLDTASTTCPCVYNADECHDVIRINGQALSAGNVYQLPLAPKDSGKVYTGALRSAWRKSGTSYTITLNSCDTSVFISKSVLNKIFDNSPLALGIQVHLGYDAGKGRLLYIINPSMVHNWGESVVNGITNTYTYADRLYCPTQCE